MNRYSTTKLAFLGAAALAVEITAGEAFSVRGARAELLLALACFAALFARDSLQGLPAAWIAGLIKDAGSAGPLGLHALLFLGVAWAVLHMRQLLFRENPLTQFAVAFVAACGVNVAAAILVSITAGGIPISVIAARTLFSALLTAAVTPPLLFLLVRAKWLVR